MQQQMLTPGKTKEDMENRFERYLSIALSLLFVSIVPFILGLIVITLTEWKIIGWTMLAVAIGCVVSYVVFRSVAYYFANKAHGA